MSSPLLNHGNGWSSREKGGRFAKGNPGGPGAPKRHYAIKFANMYDEVFDEVITRERFKNMLEVQAKMADAGDHDAFKLIDLRLKGPPVPLAVHEQIEKILAVLAEHGISIPGLTSQLAEKESENGTGQTAAANEN